MHEYCPSCLKKLYETGFASEIYLLICQYYDDEGFPITLYETAFGVSLRFLETNGYIVTTEATKDIVYAYPRVLTTDNTKMCCSGSCKYEVEFNNE